MWRRTVFSKSIRGVGEGRVVGEGEEREGRGGHHIRLVLSQRLMVSDGSLIK